jgi:hypothetical protein
VGQWHTGQRALRVRQQDVNGDFVFGQGTANYYVNSSMGVAQLIETRLNMEISDWYLDTTDGLDETQIVGYSTSSTRDLIIKQRILQTQGVTSIEEYSSNVDPETRKFTVSGQVLTQFSTTPVPFGPVTL